MGIDPVTATIASTLFSTVFGGIFGRRDEQRTQAPVQDTVAQERTAAEKSAEAERKRKQRLVATNAGSANPTDFSPLSNESANTTKKNLLGL